jgi:hypothetical protein
VVLAKVKETAATPDDATALINLQNQVDARRRGAEDENAAAILTD